MATDLQFHEAASIFPMMSDEEAIGLLEDIKENGMLNPIKLFAGKILDGRNRYLACLKLGVECETENMDGEITDPVVYVLSANLQRRNLSKSQIAMIAAAGLKLQKKLAKERQKIRKGGQPGTTGEDLPQLDIGRARDAVGKTVGLSGRAIADAAKVKREAVPELIQVVEADKLGVTTAVKLLVLSPEEQRAIATSDDPRKVASAAVKKLPGAKSKRKAKTKPDGVRPKPGYNLTKRFATESANCAITQLNQIPPTNPGREDAFLQVENWIISERIKL